jgi:RNA recognition motif-containing protein
LLHGFVEYDSEQAAYAAIQAMNGFKHRGRRMRVNWTNMRLPPVVEAGTWVQVQVHFITKNITMEVTEEFLESAFEHIGKILDVIVKRHLICTDPPHISGYGFVFFEDMITAVRAISIMKGVTVEGVQFDCQFGTPKREDRKHQHHGPSFGVVTPQVLQLIHSQQSSNHPQHLCTQQQQQQQQQQQSHYHHQQSNQSQPHTAASAAFHVLQQQQQQQQHHHHHQHHHQQQQQHLSHPQSVHHSSPHQLSGTHQNFHQVNHHGLGGMNHAPSPLTLSATSSAPVMSSRSGGASHTSSPVVSYLQPTHCGTPAVQMTHRPQQVSQSQTQSSNVNINNNYHNHHLAINGNINGTGNSNRSNQSLQQALFNRAQMSGNSFAHADMKMNTAPPATNNPNVRSVANETSMWRPAHTLLPIHQQRYASEPHNLEHGNAKLNQIYEMEKEFAQIQITSHHNLSSNHSHGGAYAGIRDSLERNPSYDLTSYTILPPPPVSATAPVSTASSTSKVHLQLQVSDRLSRSEDWLSEAMSPTAQDARLPPSFSNRSVHPIHPSASIDDKSTSLSNSDDHTTALAARGLLVAATYSRDDLHGELSSISSSSIPLPPGLPSSSSAGRYSAGLASPSVCTTAADNSLNSSLSYGQSRSFSSSFDKWHSSPLASSSTVGGGSIARSNAVFFGNSVASNASWQQDRALFVLTPSPEPWAKDVDGFDIDMNASLEENLAGDVNARMLASLDTPEKPCSNTVIHCDAANSDGIVGTMTTFHSISLTGSGSENATAHAPPGLLPPNAKVQQLQLQEHYLVPQIVTPKSRAQATSGSDESR